MVLLQLRVTVVLSENPKSQLGELLRHVVTLTPPDGAYIEYIEFLMFNGQLNLKFSAFP